MMLLSATAALLGASLIDASPISSSSGSASAAAAAAAAPRSFPLSQRRSPASRSSREELVSWANQHRHGLHAKYGLTTPEKTKRAVGEAALVNFQDDSTWFTAADFGTPATSVNMVLDTGSADIWVTPGTDSYEPSSSSTFVNETSSFSITYGSGQVAGYLATDTVVLANHSVPEQTFAVATQVSSDLLDGTTSGIIGLGFQALSTSKSTPIWSKAGETEFAFYLQRASSTSSASTSSATGSGSGGGGMPGGTFPGKRQTTSSSTSSSSSSDTTAGGYFTLGGTNTSLYQGDINWSNVITKGYWLITLGGVTVNNSTVDIGDTNKAAIDTGTTLIGGPDAVVESLYAQIPGSSAVSGADGYYQFPCDTDVNATMTFGSEMYSINSQDFLVAQVDSAGQNCMGAFFSLSTTSSSTLQWVVGGAFLKSVYSVFKDGDTAQVGFAALADGLDTVGTSSVTVAKTAQASSAALTTVGSTSSSLALLTTMATMLLAFLVL